MSTCSITGSTNIRGSTCNDMNCSKALPCTLADCATTKLLRVGDEECRFRLCVQAQKVGKPTVCNLLTLHQVEYQQSPMLDTGKGFWLWSNGLGILNLHIMTGHARQSSKHVVEERAVRCLYVCSTCHTEHQLKP